MKYKLINPIDPSKTVLEQVLYNRGITDMKTYLNPTVENTHHYSLWGDDMTRAVKLFDSVLGGDKDIYIQVDCDCFTGDTKVKLVDGRAITMEELANNPNGDYWTYSYNPETKAIVSAKITNPRIVSQRTQMCLVELDNGKKIHTTPDHRFMLSTGEYKEASQLTWKEKLMSLGEQRSIASVSVIDLDEPENFYDITVDPYHNFAIDLGETSGIIVHNCDGFSSSAIMVNYLWKLGFKDRVHYEIHGDKTHGLDMDRFFEKEYDKTIGLIIIPDAGSEEYEKHRQMAELGIPIIILDHHSLDHKSENAITINSQSPEYPNKHLCGTGVVYKFCQALDDWYGKNYANDFLDLVAVASVADMVDLTEIETKYYVQEGLKQIRNPFLKVLVDKQAYQLKDGITPFGVGFYIAPLINAVIRSGTLEEQELVFSAFLEWNVNKEIPSTKRGSKGEPELLVNQAVRLASNLQRKQKDARDRAMGLIVDKIETEELYKNKIILVDTTGLDIPRTLTGLVANQIMARYQHPVILAKTTSRGLLEGSARGYDKSELKNFKDFLDECEEVDFVAGHQSAFGTAINSQAIESFIESTNEKLKDIDFSPCYDLDFIWDGRTVDARDISSVAVHNNLWGKAMEEPFVMIKDLVIDTHSIALFSPDKSPTIKISHKGIELMKFKSSQEEYDNLMRQGERITLDVIGKCKENHWNGNVISQIMIEDYEIKQSMKWVF
jgi:single-stranded-DNA-specific exonuclease